jgi:hypothetical protein
MTRDARPSTVLLTLTLAAAACDRGPGPTASPGPERVAGSGLPAANATVAPPRDAAPTSEAPPATAAEPTTIARPDPPAAVDHPASEPIAFDSLLPLYDAEYQDPSLFVLVPRRGAAWVGRTVDAGQELPRGHRLEPKALQAMGSLHVVSTAGVQELGAYEGFAGLLPESYWRVRYEAPGIGAEPLATAGTPAATAVMRPIAASPVPVPKADALIRRAKRMVARKQPAAQQAWVSEHLTEFSKQEIDGNFAGAPRLVVVGLWADPESEDAESTEGLVGSAIFTLDAAGEVVHATASDMRVTAKALVDLDGDGTDELLTLDEGYEERGRSLYRVTGKRIQRVEIFDAGL